MTRQSLPRISITRIFDVVQAAAFVALVSELVIHAGESNRELGRLQGYVQCLTDIEKAHRRSP